MPDDASGTVKIVCVGEEPTQRAAPKPVPKSPTDTNGLSTPTMLNNCEPFSPLIKDFPMPPKSTAKPPVKIWNVIDISGFSRTAQYAMCASGVIVFFIVYGYLQEKVCLPPPSPTPPPPPQSAVDFRRFRRFVLPVCRVSGFCQFVLRCAVLVPLCGGALWCRAVWDGAGRGSGAWRGAVWCAVGGGRGVGIALAARRDALRCSPVRCTPVGGTFSAVRAQCNYLGVQPYWRPILCDIRGHHCCP